MNDIEADTGQFPIFPTTAPAVFSDPTTAKALFDAVLTQLAPVVEVDENQLALATPCDSFTVADLRRHVLAWLQFFAAALEDPTGSAERIDPETWELHADQRPSDIVDRAAADVGTAIEAGAANAMVVMLQSRMAGDGVLAMALGEYLVHGWDLAVSTGRPWNAADADGAAEAALAFLQSTVAPEYRGPDTGFFDAEVAAPPGATAFERLLCFAGRQPQWRPGA